MFNANLDMKGKWNFVGLTLMNVFRTKKVFGVTKFSSGIFGSNEDTKGNDLT